jgi:hypothetical protein
LAGGSQSIYSATFGYAPASSFPDFFNRVLTTSEGHRLIVMGCGVGFLFALVALCVSVVSFPLMLDRHASATDAMLTSVRAVVQNPVPMAAWGLIVAILLIAGTVPFFLGLTVAIPVLGHATWHLYRKVIEPVAMPYDPGPSQSAALRGGLPCQPVLMGPQGSLIAHRNEPSSCCLRRCGLAWMHAFRYASEGFDVRRSCFRRRG